MDRDELFSHLISVYRKHYLTLGFIPKVRLAHYCDGKYGKIFTVEKAFIIVGSLRSEITPIHAIYVDSIHKNRGADTLFQLVSFLPRKLYRVRAVVGHSFWRRLGMSIVRTESYNSRNREVTILEGYIN